MPEMLAQVAADFGIAPRHIKARKNKSASQRLLARSARDELCRRLTIAGYASAEIGYFLGRSRATIVVSVRRAQQRVEAANPSAE